MDIWQSLPLYATLFSALAALVLAVTAVVQLFFLNKSQAISGERERKWETIRVCDRYTYDPTIARCLQTVWEQSNGGIDYATTGRSHELVMVMNHLESIAIGVDQAVYVEDIVRDQLREVIVKAVKVFVRAESGSIGSNTWTAGKRVFTEDDYPFLVSLCDKWLPNMRRTSRYRDKS